MKIAFVRLNAAALFLPGTSESFGGAEVRSVTFARGLAMRSDHDVQMVVRDAYATALPPTDTAGGSTLRIFAFSENRKTGKDDRSLGHDLLVGCQRVTRSVQKRFSREPLPFHAIDRVDADVICAFGVQKPTPGIVKAARLSGRKSVVFLTSDADTQAALLGTGDRQRDLRDHRYGIENADLVVAQTEAQQRWVSQLGQNVALIRNPIDTRTSGVTPLARRKYMLWVGRADTDCKRADLLIDLAKACPDIPFVAVMNPTDEETTGQLYRRLPLNVRLVEQIGFQESDSLYRDALGLINTSNSEGFPNAFLQAFKYGVPVLSRMANPDDVLTVRQTGFVAHDDLDRLAAMVKKLFEDPQRFESVARAAREYVSSHHELEDRVDELDRILCDAFVAKPSTQRRAA